MRLSEAELPQHFNGKPMNLGVLLGEPSGGLIDIDLDHPVVLQIADRFLPSTPAEFGRASKPRSHRLYLVQEPIETKKYRARRRQDGSLLELRSTGQQTIFPPSVHEEGEAIEWVDPNAEPAEIAGEVLRAACDSLADAALIALGEEPRYAIERPAAAPASHAISATERVKRCLDAMQRMKVEDHNDGSHRLYCAACRCVEFDLDDGQALACLRQYEEAKPYLREWTDEQMLQRVRDAEKRCARGTALAALPSVRARIEDAELRLTDVGNGLRLVRLYGDHLRYHFEKKVWLYWDGIRWIDDTGQAQQCAKAVAASFYGDAQAEADQKRASALAAWAKGSSSAHRIEAMLKMARSEPGSTVLSEDLDYDPWHLNLPNGALDVRSGELKPHDPAMLMTKLAGAVYDPEADAPLWESFLDRIFEGDGELIAFVQRAVGSSLCGVKRDHVLFINHGNGANGKTTFIETVIAAMGDYAATAPESTLMRAQRTDRGPREDIARLHGVRLVAASESEEGRRLDESMVKLLTGGDRITARFLYGHYFSFDPNFTLWLSTNHKPEVRGTDDGIWRRVRLIPFNVRIPDSEQDAELKEKLRAELPGIFAWAVRGCREWQEQGLGLPEAVSTATQAYRAEQDVVGSFIDECCVVAPEFSCGASALYDAFVGWAKANGEEELTQTMFGRSLTARGFIAKPDSTTRRKVRCGLTIQRETP